MEWIDPNPSWMDKDGYILKVDGDGYKGTFTWITPPPFDVLIHSTPARTKGHEFEIAFHEEMWAMVAAFKEDIRKQLYEESGL